MALEGEARLTAAPEPRPELSSAAGRAAPPQPSCPWPGTCGDGLCEQKPELLAFPPELVAEQLSLMDAELFKKVVPHHCLGSIWSQRHQKGKEHVAPTVRAVISQFNRVADCVTATCLGDPSMKAADEARVVERWIEVARECRTPRNFSSGHAILSALESHAIGGQRETWAEVSRASFRLFQTLSGIVSTEINASLGSELISQEGNPKFATLDANPNRVQKQQQQQEGGAIQATVPWLGTFLTQFLIVDSAMQEFLDGTMVNFDKRRKPHDSRPHFKWHVGDRCFVHVTLAKDSGHKVQSILVTNQDRAPAVIRKALEEHELAGEQPEDYQLVQIISGDGTLQIPDGANVYYAMAPSPDYRFLLLRKSTPLDAEVKERALSAFRGSRQKGPRFRKGKL
ncbi:ral guanine nucleotide dissociation stimulator-like [Dasypus novemcinctus]|uniref:ral guanine nucleotide dissociation stimulator-like n=1 Tax=Dasypus novemcinctus TaxID=9361 RepID=UPI0039C94086